MPTQSSLSRYWRMKTSGNDVEVVVPAEPNAEDLLDIAKLFDDVMRQMRKDNAEKW